jgi:hypothetical protein
VNEPKEPSGSPPPAVPVSAPSSTPAPTAFRDHLTSVKNWIITVLAGVLVTVISTRFGVPPPSIPIPPPTPVGQKDVDTDKSDEIIRQAAVQESKMAWDKFRAQPLIQDGKDYYICGQVESLNEGATLAARIPTGNIGWTLKPKAFEGMDGEKVLAAFAEAWDEWKKVSDLTPYYVPWEDRPKALVVSEFGEIDGRAQVLAWSQLTNGQLKPLKQLYDDAESWSDRPSQGKISLKLVAMHEIGHALGLNHDTPNSGALMAPSYNSTIVNVTGRDANRLYALGYGKPRNEPDKPTPVPPTFQVPVTIYVKDVVDALGKYDLEVTPKKK